MKVLAIVCLSMLASLAMAANDTVKCYVCNSITDEACKDPFSGENAQSFLKSCNIGYRYCRKTEQTVKGQYSVVRQCGLEPNKDNEEGCYRTAGKSTQHVCTCNGNSETGCNSSFRAQSSLFLLVASAILKFLFF